MVACNCSISFKITSPTSDKGSNQLGFKGCNNIAREVKYGYHGLSQFIQQEIAKDAWLLRNGYVKSIEWHFIGVKFPRVDGHLVHY